LDGKEESLLASLAWDDGGEGAGGGAFLDVSTGGFFVRRWADAEECRDDLELLRPREVLFGPGIPQEVSAWIEGRELPATAVEGDRLYDRARAAETLARQFGTTTLRGFGLEDGEPAVQAAAAALAYARDTQKRDLTHIRGLTVRERGERMILDATTLANLEVFRSLREGGRRGTLLGVVDRTVTAPGGRTLKDWLRRPLRDPEAVAERHLAVEWLLADNARRQRLRDRLGTTGDPERLLARSVLGRLTPREAAALREGLGSVPAVLAELEGTEGLLGELAATDPLPHLAAELERVLAESPAAALKDGGVIAPGVDPELDQARSLARDSKRHILALEQRERQATGIGSLKVGYNKVFGYYVEVTKANAAKVPETYIRKQTLVNAERYITPEIKELESAILSAEERQIALEEKHFEALVERIAAEGEGLSALARTLGTLDTLAAFAEVAAKNRYVRPVMTAAGEPLVIRDGRHPVVEATRREPFVPNDLELDSEEAQIVLLTGPNMGGKSTYLRQVALIVLLAQAGSFVPAAEAKLGAVDRIFTRVGASDDLARGESTFMVEMIETANILRGATPQSLVILDEVGRGTATFDGLSLAWAIVEYLHEHRRPKTLFATHYHELTELAQMLPRVVNRTMAVKEWKDQVVFLRRVVPGSADKSWGIHVAKLAGLPPEVTARASEVLANLEAQEYDFTGKPRLARGTAPASAAAMPGQLSLFGGSASAAEQAVAERLRELDLEELTPLEALNLLAELKGELE
jgi:DNA mismatch repair protein MutS